MDWKQATHNNDHKNGRNSYRPSLLFLLHYTEYKSYFSQLHRSFSFPTSKKTSLLYPASSSRPSTNRRQSLPRDETRSAKGGGKGKPYRNNKLSDSSSPVRTIFESKENFNCYTAADCAPLFFCPNNLLLRSKSGQTRFLWLNLQLCLLYFFGGMYWVFFCLVVVEEMPIKNKSHVANSLPNIALHSVSNVKANLPQTYRVSGKFDCIVKALNEEEQANFPG